MTQSNQQSVDISKVIKKLQDRLAEALLTIAVLEVKLEDSAFTDETKDE